MSSDYFDEYEYFEREYDPSDYEDEPEYPCIDSSCRNESVWEGWIKYGDTLRQAAACDEHRDLLVGPQNENYLRGAL